MKKSTSYITRLVGAGTLGMVVGGLALMAGPQVPPMAFAEVQADVQAEANAEAGAEAPAPAQATPAEQMQAAQAAQGGAEPAIAAPAAEPQIKPAERPVQVAEATEAPAPKAAPKPSVTPAAKPAPKPAAAAPVAASQPQVQNTSEPIYPLPGELTEEEALGIAASWLADTRSFKANFKQIGPDGARSSGKVFLKQPGRVRFQYDAPSPLLIIADGVWITLADEEMGTVDRYPISATPLQVLLGDPAKLRDDAVVNGLYQDENQFELVLRSRENPGLGRMSLVFAKGDTVLQGWAVEDAQGLITQITLADAETGIALENRLFHISDAPRQNR